MLLAFGFVLFFLVFVLPLPVVHGLGDRRLGRGSNQDQVETQVLRFADGLRSGQHLHGAIGKDGANFARTNCLVHVLTNSGTAGWESSWDHRHFGLETAGETSMTR